MRRWLIALMLTVGVIIGLASVRASMSKPVSGRMKATHSLFAQFGWTATGTAIESWDELPADFKLRGGYPWPVYRDLSADAGLDFTHRAGARVETLRVRIKDSQGERLKGISDQYLLWGVALFDAEEKVVGAWITYTDKNGEFIPGIPGYSLHAKDLHQVTGVSWPAYADKHSAKD